MSITTDEIERQQAVTEETTALQDAFKKFHESGIKFNGTDAEVLEKFKAGGREIFVKDGVAFTRYDSTTVELDQALLRHAFDAPQGEVDRRTLPRTGTVGRSGVASKSGFKSIRDRVDFINTYGQEAFEALPLYPPVSGEILTQADFRKLSLSEKSRLVKDDELFVEKLAPSPGYRMPGQAFINHAALDKIKQIRPASRRLGVATAK